MAGRVRTRDADSREAAKRAAPSTVDAYLAGATNEQRAALSRVRKAVKATVPDAVEGIGYGIAGYKYRGHALVYFGYAKGHCALYGDLAMDERTAREMGYEMSGKGTLRFPSDKPLPDRLVAKMMKARVAEIEALPPKR